MRVVAQISRIEKTLDVSFQKQNSIIQLLSVDHTPLSKEWIHCPSPLVTEYRRTGELAHHLISKRNGKVLARQRQSMASKSQCSRDLLVGHGLTVEILWQRQIRNHVVMARFSRVLRLRWDHFYRKYCQKLPQEIHTISFQLGI